MSLSLPVVLPEERISSCRDYCQIVQRGDFKMDTVKCIYCGRNEADGIELSVSDIIPDGLTNKAIKNKNVCKIDHNNKFSDEFEAYVINELEYLRNYLGIHNKSNKIPRYTAEYEIEGSTFKTRLALKKEFYSGRIIPGKNESGNKILFGAIENLEKLSKFDRSKLTEVSLQEDVIQKINLNLCLFYSMEMKRLVAKIGYEWFCKIMNINDRLPEYENIINYILGNNVNEDVVSVITDVDIYNMLNDQIELGGHALTIYDDPDGFTYVVFMFFGLLIYKICIKNSDICVTDWQQIPFYGIRYDGSVVHPLWTLMNVSCKFKSTKADDGILILKDIIINNFANMMSTQILTLKNFYSTVQEISIALSSQTGDHLFNELLGYKDERTLYAVFVIWRLGQNFESYDFTKDFNINVKGILKVEEKVIFKKDELYDLLLMEYESRELLPVVEKGIDIFMRSYQKEVLESQ